MEFSPSRLNLFIDDTSLDDSRGILLASLKQTRLILAQKDEQIEKLRIKVSQFEESCMDAETETELYKNKIKRLTETLELLNSQICTKDIHITDMGDELTSLYERLESLENSKRDTDLLNEKVLKTQDKLSDVQSLLVRYECENEELKKQLKRYQYMRSINNNYEKWKQRVENITNTLNQADKAILQSLKPTENNANRLSINKNFQQFSQRDSRQFTGSADHIDFYSQPILNGLENSFENMGQVLINEELNAAKSKILQLESTLELAANTVEKYEFQIKDSETTIVSLQQSLNAAETREINLKKNLENKEQEINAHTLCIKNLESQFEVFHKEIYSAQEALRESKFKGLELEKCELSLKFELEKALKDNNSFRHQTSQQISSLNLQIESLEADLNRAQEQNQQLFSSKSSLQIENSKLSKLVSVLESNIEKNNEDFLLKQADLMKQIETHQQDLILLKRKDQSRYEEIVEELNQEKNQTLSILQKCTQLEDQLTKSQERLSQVTSNWRIAEKKCEEKEYEILEDQDKVSRLKARFEILENEILKKTERNAMLEEQNSALNDRLIIAVQAVQVQQDLQLHLEASRNHQQEVIDKIVRLEYENETLQRKCQLLMDKQEEHLMEKREQSCSTRSLSSLELFDKTLGRSLSNSSSELPGKFPSYINKSSLLSETLNSKSNFNQWPPYVNSTTFLENNEEFKLLQEPSEYQKFVSRSVLMPYEESEIHGKCMEPLYPISQTEIKNKPNLKYDSNFLDRFSESEKNQLFTALKQLARDNHKCQQSKEDLGKRKSSNHIEDEKVISFASAPVAEIAEVDLSSNQDFFDVSPKKKMRSSHLFSKLKSKKMLKFRES